VIWAVVLAAGASSRLGEPKALVRGRDGRRFVDAIAETARAGGCGGVVVVVGPPHGEAIRRALPVGAGAAWNPQPARGMLSSVQAGLAALPPGGAAALVWPVDIPFVQSHTVRAILGAAAGRIIVPVHHERGGHPLRLPGACFADVMALDPERGLKALLEARRAEVTRLAVDDPAVLVDIDTPAELARLR
jgi:CTP:molybdopterin cytidylyltransferase MocA